QENCQAAQRGGLSHSPITEGLHLDLRAQTLVSMQTQSKNGEGSASSPEMTGIGKPFFDTRLTKGSVYCSSPAFMHKQAQLACDNGGIMARRSADEQPGDHVLDKPSPPRVRERTCNTTGESVQSSPNLLRQSVASHWCLPSPVLCCNPR